MAVCVSLCRPFGAASDEWHFQLGEQPPFNPIPAPSACFAGAAVSIGYIFNRIGDTLTGMKLGAHLRKAPPYTGKGSSTQAALRFLTQTCFPMTKVAAAATAAAATAAAASW